MTHEFINEQEQQTPLQEIVAVNPLDALPMRINDAGDTVTDWGALMAMTASPDAIAAYIGTEIARLAQSTDQSEVEQGEQLKRGIGGVIRLYDGGRLPGMRDVFELTSFIMERNPSLTSVESLMNRGYSAVGVALLYDASDTLGIALNQADKIFGKLGFSYNDEQDISIVDNALDTILEKRELKYRHTACEILEELLEDGRSIRDILDGMVY